MAPEAKPVIEPSDTPDWVARIKVVGVGGGGGNVVNTLAATGVEEPVELIAAHTKQRALEASLAPVKVQLGPEVTRGFGCGGNVEQGRQAAHASADQLSAALTGADMVFVAAGMGRGTGTGAAPVVAEIARDLGALTVAVVTTPFPFEGRQRMEHARIGIAALEKVVDALLVISNERLIDAVGHTARILDAFRYTDDVLCTAIAGITHIVLQHGHINVDFADVRTIVRQSGRALMGTGEAAGDRKAIWAAQQAVKSPLFEGVSIDGAAGLLVNVTSGPDLTLSEMNEAMAFIQQAAHEDAMIILGHVVDAELVDRVRVTVVATGIGPDD